MVQHQCWIYGTWCFLLVRYLVFGVRDLSGWCGVAGRAERGRSEKKPDFLKKNFRVVTRLAGQTCEMFVR